jgi:PiT family inorganic phosphate transporter
MEPLVLLLALVVVLALIFDYINGFHDSANAIATVVATKVMKPSTAVAFGGILNFAGALAGTEVAATIGKGLVDSATITLSTVLCSVLAAIFWNLITWYKGLPTSSSHALIGSLLGATFASGAVPGSIHWNTVMEKIVIPMISSPLLGFAIGFIIMTALTWIIYKMNLGLINRVFGKLQIFSAGFMAFEHGRNDAQKSMGIIALALVMVYPQDHFSIPLWVKIACALAMAAGTWTGGWRIIHTLGNKLIKLQPVHGFAAETSASIIISVASHFGIPVSTTQVISSSILGVGTIKRASAVNWGVFGNIVWAWILTLPLTFGFAGLLMTLLKYLF